LDARGADGALGARRKTGGRGDRAAESVLTSLEHLMPLIHVTQTPGQSAEEKAELLRELTHAYVKVTGAKPASVWATVAEVPTDSWSVAGETLAARAAEAKAAQG
jgi:4-oxalocrotonate tautomerase